MRSAPIGVAWPWSARIFRVAKRFAPATNSCMRKEPRRWHPAASLVVFHAGDGPHERDLWVTVRSGLAWGAPRLLTADSPYALNEQPAISADGTKVAVQLRR